MNVSLRHCKAAATVILAARTSACLKTSETRSPPDFTESDLPPKPAFDYEVLLLKRSGKSGFMPNAHVFPGGLLEPSDFSNDWLETFKSFRHQPNFGVGFVKQAPETRPPVFATDRQKLGSLIPSAVALRICAVRETFEESGIVLVVPKKQNNIADSLKHPGDNNVATSLTKLNELVDERELARWRSLVTENPFNFIHMCGELDCMPNIWAMHEWGNWLTPTLGFETGRRYDAAFFICCLEDIPPTIQDEKEIVHFKWSSPDAMQSFQGRKLFLGCPQTYELGRLSRFPQLQGLLSFARMRAQEGCEWFRSILLECRDRCLLLLPGDELYPEDADCTEERGGILRSEEGFEQLQREDSVLHRLVLHGPYTVTVQMSITPKYKHLLPIGGLTQHKRGAIGSFESHTNTPPFQLNEFIQSHLPGYVTR